MIIPVTAFLLSAIIASGVVIALVFLSSRPTVNFKYYTLAFFTCLLLIYIEHFIEFSELVGEFPLTVYMSSACYYLLAPLLNLIIKSFFGEDLIKRKFWIELVPALVNLIYMIPFYALPADMKHNYVLEYAQADFMAPRHMILIGGLFLQLVIYAVIWYERLRHYSQSVKSRASTGDLEFIPWLSRLIGLIVTFIFSIIIVTFVRILWPDLFSLFDQTENIVLSLIPHVFIFLLFFLPEKPFPKVSTSLPPKLKEQHDFSPEVIDRLERLMRAERLFLNPDLTLAEVAEKLGLSRHKLSALLSQGLGKSFYDFVNEYRVREAKTLMDSDMVKTFSLSGIARESGFNNYVSFYRVFKRFTHQAPSDYLKRRHPNKQ